MSLPRIAPVFTVEVDRPVDQVLEKLKGLTCRENGAFDGSAAGNHITLTVREADRHFWSPWANIEVTEREGKAHVRCRFTPHPSVWTGFAFSYFSLFVIAAFAAVWGMSQWMLQSRPTAFWGVLVSAVLIGLLFWAAQVGQRLAREQMHVLRDAVDAVTA